MCFTRPHQIHFFLVNVHAQQKPLWLKWKIVYRYLLFWKHAIITASWMIKTLTGFSIRIIYLLAYLFSNFIRYLREKIVLFLMLIYLLIYISFQWSIATVRGSHMLGENRCKMCHLFNLFLFHRSNISCFSNSVKVIIHVAIWYAITLYILCTLKIWKIKTV